MSKLFIVFTIVLLGFAASDNDEMKKQEETIAQKCKAKVGASEDDLKDLLENNPSKTKQAECLHACVLRELELVDYEGKLIRNEYELYISKFSEDKDFIEKSMKIFDECDARKEWGRTCAEAEELRLCLQTEGEKLKGE